MKKSIICLMCVSLAQFLISLTLSGCEKDNTGTTSSESSTLVATDYLTADGKTDVTEAIQRLIDSNPNRTILFPDGVYLISRSILTPADPKKSVSLVLENYAVFQATGPWKEGGAVLRLGGSNAANNIYVDGSNYGIKGGIIDGGGVADGISIDSGRETKIQDVSIKHTQTGIYIKFGANSGSSDSDISGVNIVGNNKPNSIGVLIEGYDNTMTNMRIAAVNVGVWVKTGGNSLKNIHPLYIFGDDQDYASSCGFKVEQTNNWFNYCYSDQFATGFWTKENVSVNFTDCFCYWYSGKVNSQTAIHAEGPFNSIVTGLRVGFHKDCPKVSILLAEKGGKGVLMNQMLPDRELSSDDVSSFYMK